MQPTTEFALSREILHSSFGIEDNALLVFYYLCHLSTKVYPLAFELRLKVGDSGRNEALALHIEAGTVELPHQTIRLNFHFVIIKYTSRLLHFRL